VFIVAGNLNTGNSKWANSRQLKAPQTSPSRFLQALNRFTGGIKVQAYNPLREKFGKGYEHLIAGDACRFREELEPAIQHYLKALQFANEINEPCLEAYLGISKCYTRKGDLKNAIQYLSMAVQQNAFSAEAHNDLAKCLNDSGNTQKAMFHYKRAIRLNTRFVDARFGLALLLESKGDIENAIKQYQQILEIDPEFLPSYNNLGSIYLRQNALDKAEHLFRALIVKAPTFTRGHLGLAMTCDRAGKCVDAIQAYEAVVQLRPNGKNMQFIAQRLIQMNMDLGRSVTRHNTTLVRVK
jgi:tetratricopeptide (TPR) repeat protein